MLRINQIDELSGKLDQVIPVSTLPLVPMDVDDHNIQIDRTKSIIYQPLDIAGLGNGGEINLDFTGTATPGTIHIIPIIHDGSTIVLIEDVLQMGENWVTRDDGDLSTLIIYTTDGSCDSEGYYFWLHQNYIRPTNLPSAISAAKIADGNVSNTEFQRLNGVTADIQKQFNQKATRLSLIHLKSVAFTLALSQSETYIRANNASSISVTVPPESSVVFASATVITIEQTGVGQINLVAGSGVTLHGDLRSSGQYATVQITKVGSDEWTVKDGV